MTVQAFTESVVEEVALAWLEFTGWRIANGPDISLGGDALTLALSQRTGESDSEVVFAQRLRDKLVPKLISGELRLKDAESFLQRVTE